MPRPRGSEPKLEDKFTVGDGCWLWTAACDPGGYGMVWDPRQQCHVRAHRAVYKLLVGPIPDELPLDHLCHNADETCMGGPTCPHRRCVRPAHLEPVTHKVNINRGRAAIVNSVRLRGRTHCEQGHLFDAANTYVYPDGRRSCRRCSAERGWRHRVGSGTLQELLDELQEAYA